MIHGFESSPSQHSFAVIYRNTTMQNERFDLNDIDHEPSDEQLAALMESVAVEVRQRAMNARDALMTRLRAEIAKVNEQDLHP